MITFPTWVELPRKQPKPQLASKRLRYLVLSAANRVCPNGTVSDFAKHCGVDRTSVHNFIAAGAFSARTATKIEEVVGRDVLCHEWLMRPLEIETETTAQR